MPQYNGYHQLYTDGSKQDEVASFGLHCELGDISKRILDGSSIFTAELEGIQQALRAIDVSTLKKFVIFCDPKSVLESIDNYNTDNPLVVQVLDHIQSIPSHKIVKFCWIPSHVGIPGNELADAAANEARAGEEDITRRIPSSDLNPLVKNFIRDKWQRRYDDHHSYTRPLKLKEIMPTISPFYVLGHERREEVVIHRLRIGHTRLTHGFLMENRPDPICNFCHNDILTVRHLLLECNRLNNIRSNFYDADDLEDLFDRYPFKPILDFLREIRVFDLI